MINDRMDRYLSENLQILAHFARMRVPFKSTVLSGFRRWGFPLTRSQRFSKLHTAPAHLMKPLFYGSTGSARIRSRILT